MRYRVALLWCACLALATVTPGFARSVAYSFGAETPPTGWYFGGSWAVSSSNTVCSVPATGHSGSAWFSATGTSCGYASPITSAEQLISPTVDCTGRTRVTVGFWQNVGLRDSHDSISLLVTNDSGANWHTVASTTGPSFSPDHTWEYVEYDISAYADNQPAVALDWVLGPTDGTGSAYGWLIDDIQVMADGLEVLAWTPYIDPARDEWRNTQDIITTNLPGVGITISTSLEAATVARELRGKQVFLVPEPELGSHAELVAAGTALAGVLQAFVKGGGTVVVLSELKSATNPDADWNGFLSASGLMSFRAVSFCNGGEILEVVDPYNPLVAGLSSTSMAAQDSTAFYRVSPDADVVVTNATGEAVVAERMYGAGAAVLIGFDYYIYDADAAQILVNAMHYPASRRGVLVYDNNDNLQHVGLRAVNRLRLPYVTVAGASDFSSWLSHPWEAVVVDAPSLGPTDGWTALSDYVSYADPLSGAHHQVLLSTWGLDGALEPGRATLAAAFGASSGGSQSPVPALYDWSPSGGLFELTESVPSPISLWANYWDLDADPLTPTGVGAWAPAGFAATPDLSNGAIVAGNGGASLLNGFLWDEQAQDADGDGVLDVEELVTNQVAYLLSVPDPAFHVDPTEIVTGGTVNLLHDSVSPNTHCFLWYADGYDTLISQSCTPFDDSYSYDTVGFYFPVLEEDNGNGWRRVTLEAPVAVGFPDAGPGFWAFRHIIGCYEAGIVTGFKDGSYQPGLQVNRGQMAAYIARALCGGEANVPSGPMEATFPDVPVDFPFFRHVEYAVAHGVVTGYKDGSYQPSWAVNRGQMAAFLARALVGGEVWVPTGPSTADFPDVPTNYGFFRHVEYIYGQGVTTGYKDGTFHPEYAVNRDQMAVFIQRAFAVEAYLP